MLLGSLKDLEANLWVFDCDGVIYDSTKEAEKEVMGLMSKFIALHFGCSVEEALNIRQELLRKYQVPNTVMALVREGFNEREILKNTYFAINFKKLGIVPSPELHEFLCSLPGKKVVLSNNHKKFIQVVLNILGISNCFSAIYGAEELSPARKPDLRAFKLVQNTVGISDKVVFIDDEIPNVIVAEQFGWTAIWKGNGNGYDGLAISKLR
ncbi:MAG: HAD-IA family hydrolase [Patescibacteria group bacterium]